MAEEGAVGVEVGGQQQLRPAQVLQEEWPSATAMAAAAAKGKEEVRRGQINSQRGCFHADKVGATGRYRHAWCDAPRYRNQSLTLLTQDSPYTPLVHRRHAEEIMPYSSPMPSCPTRYTFAGWHPRQSPHLGWEGDAHDAGVVSGAVVEDHLERKQHRGEAHRTRAVVQVPATMHMSASTVHASRALVDMVCKLPP